MARTNAILAVALCCLLATCGLASAAGNRKLKQFEGCTSIYGVLTTPGLETLGAAVAAVGLAGVTSNQTAPYTVFAPSNEAFEDLLDALNVTALTDVLSVDDIRNVILYHLLPYPVTTRNIADAVGRPVETVLPGQTVEIEVEGSKVTVMGFGSDATVTVADVLTGCGNGVVHIVDTVLLPDLAAARASVASQSTR